MALTRFDARRNGLDTVAMITARSSPRVRVAWWAQWRGGSLSIQSRSAAPERRPARWLEYKHPHSDGDDAVVVSSAGELAILIPRAAGDSAPPYDLLDKSGRLVRRLQLPPGMRLLAIAKRFIYLTRNDADGLQHVHRFRER